MSIVRTLGTGAAGTFDTYTITYSDATTSTFQVYNGANGAGGGSGDVAGPASSTDNAIARFDGATGKVIQNSLATLDDLATITLQSVRRLQTFKSGGTPFAQILAAL